MNVLDLTGPEFLGFYFALLIIATFGAIVLRFVLRGPGGALPQMPADLDPHEIAYLSGGPRGAVNAALAGLVHRNALALSKGGSKLITQTPSPPDLSATEQQICRMVASGRDRIVQIRARSAALTRALTSRLRTTNLALMPGQSLLVRLAPALLLVGVLCLGVLKIHVGLSRHRPVGFLGMLCVMTGCIAAIFLFKGVWSTRSGDWLLSTLRSDNSALRSSAKTSPQTLEANDLVLALALFGPTVLATGRLLDLRMALWPPNNGGSSASCGGSSCGGGGCGGGGCGGCGG